MTRILLLAGTAEARAVAQALTTLSSVEVEASLAGATTDPAPYPCTVRVGGFGGPKGLEKHLRDHRCDLLVDATHPYASQMQANAVHAANAADVPRIRLLRDPWPNRPGWVHVPDLSTAARSLPPDAHALLTTGRKEVQPFANREDCKFTLRTIEAVADLPSNITTLRARPPFSVDSERALFALLGITHLITKNAGGAGTAKLDVADEMRLTTFVVDRPTPPPGPIATSLEATVAWVRQTVGF